MVIMKKLKIYLEREEVHTPSGSPAWIIYLPITFYIPTIYIQVHKVMNKFGNFLITAYLYTYMKGTAITSNIGKIFNHLINYMILINTIIYHLSVLISLIIIIKLFEHPVYPV